MIATVSPAASSTEETLSTLRYAKQACSIINIAKVNEDVNAKLIRGEVDICSLWGFFSFACVFNFLLNKSCYY